MNAGHIIPVMSRTLRTPSGWGYCPAALSLDKENDQRIGKDATEMVRGSWAEGLLEVVRVSRGWGFSRKLRPGRGGGGGEGEI